MSIPFFQAEQLLAGYGRKEILHHLNFTLEEGFLTALLGPNGCGKTTLLKTICRLLPYSGTMTLQGTSLETLKTKQLAKQFSYIPQKRSLTPALSVLDVVLMGFNPVLKILENPSKEQKSRAIEALCQVGLDGMEDIPFSSLSEGQKQLVLLARTLIEDTKLLLLDEPDSALDFSNRHKILGLLQKLVKKRKLSALITLHDPNLALAFCDRLLLMKDGRIVDTVLPGRDDISKIESAFSQVFGPVLVTETVYDGQIFRTVLPHP